MLIFRKKRFDIERRKRKTIKESFSELGFIREKRRREADREIYEGISMLRNMAASGGPSCTSERAFATLSERDGVLKEAYLDALSLLRMNRKKEAVETFYEKAGTEMSREFGALLIKLDDINAAELSEILISHQKNIKEARKTEQKRLDETLSDIIYLPVVLNVMIIFINFIYIAYLMQQREILNMLFA